MLYIVITIIVLFSSCFIFYKKRRKEIESNLNGVEHDHAIILGGSMAGMATAAYLSKHFKRITIIESDDVFNDVIMKATPDELLDYRCRLESPTSLGRSGVSQIYHVHVIQKEGADILHQLFPNSDSVLINKYSTRFYSLKTESMFLIGGILFNQNHTQDIDVLGVDRFTLEIVLRKQLCEQYGDKIEWICNARVAQLIANSSTNSIEGVKYRLKKGSDSFLHEIYGDFVVDCTGRSGSSLKWLKDCLDLNVPTEQMHFGGGYVTFVCERLKTGDPSLDSKHNVYVATNPPKRNTGLYVTPIRTLKVKDESSIGDIAAIAVHCVNGEYPPNDSFENLVEWSKEHLDGDCISILKATKLLGPLIPYRKGFNDRKYVECLGNKWPHNYVLLGDAMCAFDPQLGQGITHGLRQARELNEIFKEGCHKFADISHLFNRRASKITSKCWVTSTASDWHAPTIKIIKTDVHGNTKVYHRGGESEDRSETELAPPLFIRFMHWYNYWFLHCAGESGQLATEFVLVLNQKVDSIILMKPSTVLQVCWKALKARFRSN